MRLSRLVTLIVGLVAMTGCGKDKVTDPSFPALAGVRFINAVADTGAIDVRAIDQIEFSPVANGLAFRSGTQHQPTEAKSRHFRAFITSTNPAITSNPIVDTTVIFSADLRYTVLLTGSARTKVQFVVINDDAPAPPAGQIAIRAVNASAGAIDAYVVDSTNTALPATASIANVAPLAASPYGSRAAGKVALRVTDAGAATVNASQQGPYAPLPVAGALPAAGVNTATTPFSVFYFPRSVAGSGAPQTAAFLVPAIVWFVDRVPAS